MKIVLLCNPQHNQVALANKIAQQFKLAGIVIEKNTAAKKNIFSLAALMEKILNKTIFVSLRNAWFGMLDQYKKQYPSFPRVASLNVENINSEETVNFIKKINPDLIMVSGTSLIRKKILELDLPFGIINLHTGLSPYIKGGPNCTNWCIADNKIHLIGNTVMWIDAGIDSGDLITTSLTPLSGNETLLELHFKVMEHAHKIYLDALRKIRDDYKNCPRVKQSSVATGTIYYNKQWNWKAKRSLFKNMRMLSDLIRSEKYLHDKANVVTVTL